MPASKISNVDADRTVSHAQKDTVDHTMHLNQQSNVNQKAHPAQHNSAIQPNNSRLICIFECIFKTII